MRNVIPVVIPAYEPDENFIVLLEDLSEKNISPIVVVDDGSGEAYAEIFERARQFPSVTVINHAENLGKGAALKTAFAHCLSIYSDMLGCVTCDCDGQHTAAMVAACRVRLQNMPDKFILGVRKSDDKTTPHKLRFWIKLTALLLRITYKADVSDTQSGLRGIPAAFMEESLQTEGNGFEFEINMLVDAIQKRIRIKEFPIEAIYEGKDSHAAHFRPIVDSIRVVRAFGFVFGRFALSSLSSTLIDMALFSLLCAVLGSLSPALRVVLATVGARMVSATFNYILNYFLVFKSKQNHAKSAPRFFLIAAAQMGCSALLVSGICSLIPVEVELMVKIPVDLLLFFVNYTLQKKFVY